MGGRGDGQKGHAHRAGPRALAALAVMTSLAGSFAFDEAATERYRRFGLPHQYWRAFPVYRFEAVMGSRPLLPRMRPANKVLYLYFLPPTGSDNTLIGAAAPLHGRACEATRRSKVLLGQGSEPLEL